MKRPVSFLPCLLAIALVACGSAGAPAPHTASFDQEVQLAPGELVVFGQQELYVEFLRVSEDSRCPIDATCVWAGEVKLQLSIRSGAAQAGQHEITAGQAATVNGFRVDVTEVRPQRVATREISPEEYRITLKAERV